MPEQSRESFKIRLDPLSDYQLTALAAKKGLPRATIIRLALRMMAEAEGIPAPPENLGEQAA
jgi:hypothetical protein